MANKIFIQWLEINTQFSTLYSVSNMKRSILRKNEELTFSLSMYVKLKPFYYYLQVKHHFLE